jgi:hypothetical protein
MIGMLLLFLYIFYFVGSARHDAEYQMRACQLLIAAFGIMTAIMSWSVFSSFTRWNTDAIEQDRLFVGRRSVRFDEIVAVRRVTWCESLRIDGSDGSTIFVPLGHNGSREFTDTLGERLDARMGGHFRNRYSRLQISIGGVFRETLH